MKKTLQNIFATFIIIALAIGLAGLCVAAFISSRNQPEESLAVKTAQAQAKLDEIARTNLMSTVWACVAVIIVLAIIGCLTAWVWSKIHINLELSRADIAIKMTRILPDNSGNYAALVAAQGIVSIPPGNLRGPAIGNFAPQISYPKSEKELLAPSGSTETLPALPGFIDFSNVLNNFWPTSDKILLGLRAGGDLITCQIKDLCHVALGGKTGNGKDGIMRLLIPQILAAGGMVFLADPHFASVDPDTGEDWRMIENCLLMPPATKAGDITEMLDGFVKEMDRRLEARRDGIKGGAPYFFVANEISAIIGKTDITDNMARILREGRKVGMMALNSSQDWLVTSTGMNSGIREQLATRYYVGGDSTTGAFLMETSRKNIEGYQLGKGVALLKIKQSESHILTRLPLASNAALHRLLPGFGEGSERVQEGSGRVQEGFRVQETPILSVNALAKAEPENSPVQAQKAPEPAFTLDALQPQIIAELSERGINQKAVVIKILTGATKGGSENYRLASEKYDEIMQGRTGNQPK